MKHPEPPLVDEPLVPMEMRELLRFERLLTELSVDFIDRPVLEIEPAIHDSLGRIVAALEIDRCTLNRVFPISGWIAVTHSFAVEGVDPVPKSLPARPIHPWIMSRSLQNLPSVFERLEDIPPEAEVDKEAFRRIGLKSHVTMPIVVGGELQGSLSFGCVRAERAWPAKLLARMRLLSQIFGGALARKQAQEHLEIAIGFERLASSILASLVMTPQGSEHAAIAAGLKQIGEFVEAEEVALWERCEPEGSFRIARAWQAVDSEASARRELYGALPWISARIAGGHLVRIVRLYELDPAADRDAAALAAMGVQSLLVLPISVAGRNAGALSMASAQREHEWPEALMPGVTLLAEVFGSLHAREAAERLRHAAEGEAAHWRERLAHLVRVHTAGEMSVALAHEITQPLGAIENYALAALRRMGEASPDLAHVADLLGKVVGQATRAGDVVSRMRNMVQRHELDPKAIDVERAVLECIAMVKMDCEVRNISIQRKPLADRGSIPIVMVDEIHLQQVLLNLLRNAMEAIEAGAPDDARTITVTTTLDGHEHVAVAIGDSGTGIADGNLEQVFESFYSTKANGLGVGLAICRKLIQAHGGKLWAAHNPGGGALFTFTIPIATRPA